MVLARDRLSSWSLITLMVRAVAGNNYDEFNYGFNDARIPGGIDYGQQNWGKVTCDNLQSCAGYPDKYLETSQIAGFSVGGANNCRWCVEGGSESCGLHRQSPIDLPRNRGIIGHPLEKECPDWHYMQYRDGTCSWDDMKDQFEISRSSLRVNIPVLPNGDIDCVRPADNVRQYPRLDYSKGFPDWFWLDHTEIQVPSGHTQEGKKYAAEVILAHFYQIPHDKNQLGHVSIFLQDYPDAESWPFLDKLICNWRKEEEAVRSACGLRPAPPYGRCTLFRDQEPTEEWLFEEAGVASATQAPTPSSTVKVETKEPTEKVEALEPTPSPNDGKQTVSTPEPTDNQWGYSINRPLKGRPNPQSSTSSATAAPVASPTDAPVAFEPARNNGFDALGGEDPPPIDCGSISGASYERMCSSGDPCCESKRSDTDFCWNNYEVVFPGDMIYSACRWCCPSGGKQIGPPNPEKPGLPKTIMCSDVSNPNRICKPNSCCTNPRSTSSYCAGIYAQYGDDMEQICHYCCSEPKEVGPAFRFLRGQESNTTFTQQQPMPALAFISPNNEGISKSNEDLLDGAKLAYAYGRKLLLRKENFDEAEDEFEKIYSDFKHRSMQYANTTHSVDYEDVHYWPYEWLVKVGTEYYFRYEGTMMVPPCWEVVHWRVMKDPIRVHKRQIDELNRLLAWRISPGGNNRCQPDTAGVVAFDGKSVDLSRRTQYYHLQHRMVFCECKDWPSKFEGDKQWCNNWRNDAGYIRFYDTPYNFDTGGDW